MIRKFNYTGRKKINHSDISISIFQDGQIRSFNARINFELLGLNPYAAVYIESYYQFYSMRFGCGTVERFAVPADTSLSDMPVSDHILFRVIVVDETGLHGKLLAYAEQLKPSDYEDETANRKSLLPVEFGIDLGQQVWKMSFTGPVPVLCINRKLDHRRDLVKSYEFISLVFPAVIREIMTKITREYPDYGEEDDHWSCLWYQFAKRTLGVYDLPAAEEVADEDYLEWVDEVAESFCRKNNIVNRFKLTSLAK